MLIVPPVSIYPASSTVHQCDHNNPKACSGDVEEWKWSCGECSPGEYTEVYLTNEACKRCGGIMEIRQHCKNCSCQLCKGVN